MFQVIKFWLITLCLGARCAYMSVLALLPASGEVIIVLAN